jgi:hypothetical protein
MTTYYKITNIQECHNGYQYHDGLNILPQNFNDNPNASCCPHGFYFTDIKNIFKYVNYGVFVRKITLPTEDSELRVMLDSNGDKWRANRVIFGERYNLADVFTIQYLIEQGADIHIDNDKILQYAAIGGHLDIVHLLADNGANIHANDDAAFRKAAGHGHLEVVQYLVKRGANISEYNNMAFQWAVENGHIDVAAYLLNQGADVHANRDYALRISARNGNLNLVAFLIDKGAIIDASDALFNAAIQGHVDIIKYLVGIQFSNIMHYAAMHGHVNVVQLFVEYGSDIKSIDNDTIVRIQEAGHTEMVKYLEKNGLKADVSKAKKKSRRSKK